jgi:hypothetical protein
MGDRRVRYIKVCESLVLEGSASRRDVERDCCRGCRLRVYTIHCMFKDRDIGSRRVKYTRNEI